MVPARRGGSRLGLDLWDILRHLVPLVVAWLAWRLASEGAWRGILTLTAALLAAMAMVFLRGRRLARLRCWVDRVRAGEEAVPPLASRAADEIDHLALDLGSMVGELRGARTRLEFERDRLEAILAGMVEGVLVIDASGTVLRANERVRATFAVPQDARLVGSKLWDLSRDVEFNAVVREVLARRLPTVREVELQGPQPRSLNVTAGPTADGTAWVLVLHDVTETKRLERVRTDFVANVSHELRTPLTAIKGFAETLVSKGFDDRKLAERYLAIIDRQAERLSRLIDDLLVLSDLELGRMPVRIRPTRLGDVVHEVVELLEEPAGRGGVRLQVEVPRDLVIPADPDRLVQVVSNLVDNAIKFTPVGGAVTVSAAPGRSEGEVAIRVSDTGQGIPAEDLPRLAERFYRVDKARSREFGGTGLGLSIVKHIVLAHGGRLQIESRLGSGTTVTVTLPTIEVPSRVQA